MTILVLTKQKWKRTHKDTSWTNWLLTDLHYLDILEHSNKNTCVVSTLLILPLIHIHSYTKYSASLIFLRHIHTHKLPLYSHGHLRFQQPWSDFRVSRVWWYRWAASCVCVCVSEAQQCFPRGTGSINCLTEHQGQNSLLLLDSPACMSQRKVLQTISDWREINSLEITQMRLEQKECSW